MYIYICILGMYVHKTITRSPIQRNTTAGCSSLGFPMAPSPLSRDRVFRVSSLGLGCPIAFSSDNAWRMHQALGFAIICTT